MSARELKAVLLARGVPLVGILERGDLVRACRESSSGGGGGWVGASR